MRFIRLLSCLKSSSISDVAILIEDDSVAGLLTSLGVARVALFGGDCLIKNASLL